ncbi:MAG: ribosome silencing factor [Ardenticatenaceae bacterium]|nr:ribosome silencing factor [Ardenticatenaceae bacterium]
MLLEALELANLLVDTIADKKGGDVIILDMREQSVLTDFFLICTANSDRQIKAIAEAIWDDSKQKGDVVAMGQEGSAESGWILIDFGDLIVHVFSEEKREFYNLEELWQEGRVMLRMP